MIKKISDSFTRTIAENLQNEVIFSILYYLGARGREEFRRLRRKDISIKIDSEGKTFVQVTSEDSDNIRKKTKPSLKVKEYSNNRINRIYDVRAIEAIKIYLDVLNQEVPDSDNLFPRPLNNKNQNLVFSPKQVRGEHWLGDFLKYLSKKLGLSKTYTNHCIRCTAVTTGKENGFSNQEVALITGHKDDRSIDRYDRPSDSRKHRLVSALSLPNNSIEQKEQRIEDPINSTTTNNEINNIMNMITKSSGNNIQVFSNCTVYLQR